jgi:uncharacterized protein with HEPN domain
MFRSRNLVHILTTLESIEKIIIYTAPFNEHESFFWANDQLNYNATFNLLLVIGEETKKIESNLKSAFATIRWTEIAGLRNHLAHNYRGADPEVLFGIVKNNLPDLKKALIRMLALIEIDGGSLDKFLLTDHYKNIRYLLKNL